MKKTILFINIFMLCVFSGKESFGKNELTEKVVKLVNEAVFEVVIQKPVKDNLKYEKPLPLENLPFSERSDKYYSIGTAFAVSEKEFVTAAHVLNLERETRYGGIFIRDAEKNVFEIDSIVKYSFEKDFVVFTVKNRKQTKYLSFSSEEVALNKTVYAVGNAYGEGVIIRDGMLTSKTPEEEKGAWVWLRFSAAASPGNSGGPLLDVNGNIIGLILRKSENENLNYALPAFLIKTFPSNKAEFHGRVRYRTAVTGKTVTGIYDKDFTLPMNYGQFRKEMSGYLHEISAKLADKFLVENKPRLFPNGKGSLQMLNKYGAAVFPNLICEGDDGTWDIYFPEKKEKGSLDNGGYLNYGTMLDMEFAYFHKPDEVSMKDLFNEPKRFMDLYTKAAPFKRPVGDERVSILSFGEPSRKELHVDKYGRKWIAAVWDLDYSDQAIALLAIPVPGGLVSILKFGQTDDIYYNYLPDLKMLTDYVYVTYFGTFKEWGEFLEQKEYLPPVLSKFKFSYGGGKASVDSGKVFVNYGEELQSVTGDSEMKLYMSFFKENGNVVWDIAALEFWENKANDNFYLISREGRPEQGLADSFEIKWKKLSEQDYPYNKTSYKDKGSTYIKALHPRYVSSGEKVSGAVKYTVTVGREGDIDDAQMKARIEKACSSAIINE